MPETEFHIGVLTFNATSDRGNMYKNGKISITFLSYRIKRSNCLMFEDKYEKNLLSKRFQIIYEYTGNDTDNKFNFSYPFFPIFFFFGILRKFNV